MTLLDGEHYVGIPGHVLTSREWASDQLQEVSEYCFTGSYPHEIKAFDLGRAIGRALSNNNEDDSYGELRRGIEHYLHSKGETGD
jgi:hypothetical protein